jgi:transcription elongation factor GreA
LGDFTENDEYSEAKEEQSLVESRILELEETLRRVKMIEKHKGAKTVMIGSNITVLDQAQHTQQFDIVGSNEADPAAGKISNESPLGKAFLGRKVGDAIAVAVPRGTVTYTLKKIA